MASINIEGRTQHSLLRINSSDARESVGEKHCKHGKHGNDGKHVKTQEVYQANVSIMKIIKSEIVMFKSRCKSALFDYTGKAGNIIQPKNMKSK